MHSQPIGYRYSQREPDRGSVANHLADGQAATCGLKGHHKGQTRCNRLAYCKVTYKTQYQSCLGDVGNTPHELLLSPESAQTAQSSTLNGSQPAQATVNIDSSQTLSIRIALLLP